MSGKSISLSVLVENTVSQGDLRAEHGFSVWIETPRGSVLWDTGQSALFHENAQKMGIIIEKTACIALSHGHYDHTGGLSTVLALHPGLCVYGHPDLFRQRYSKTSGNGCCIRPIGSPVTEEFVREKRATLTLSDQPSEIIPGVFLTGEIPRITGYEDAGGDFYLDLECTIPDTVVDDQALYIKTSRGIVVLLGCAHSGVVNTLNHIVRLAGKEKICGVMGGMHLLNASDERLEETARAFEYYDVQIIGPSHCTGDRAKTMFRSEFPRQTIACTTGTRLTFEI